MVHYLWLVLITLAGAGLRFSFLNRPTIWGDEAMTFQRVSGSFADLLQRLSDAGFAPVHYELLWLIGQHFKLTPFVMRFVPALTGTLMIPAMYWLTRELLGRSRSARSIAMLTALLTAGNAYLLNYSRDAKMYSPFWMFATVNVAALLWWLRHRRGVPYWCWLASGTAMLAFDTLGVIILVIELLIVLTAARAHWRSIPRLIVAFISSSLIWILTAGPFAAVAALLGDVPGRMWWWIILVLGLANLCRLAVMAVVPKLWHGRGDIWAERAVIRPWVRWINDRFAFPPIVLFVIGLTVMALGPIGYYVEFNQFFTHVDDRGWRATGIDWIGKLNRGRDGAELAGATASAYLTAWEWPKDTDLAHVSVRTYRLLDGSMIAIAALLALGLLPWRAKRTAEMIPDEHAPGPSNRFRTALWMTAWMVLPPYGFYCVSFRDQASPGVWFQTAWDFILRHWWSWPLIAVVGAWWFWCAGRNWIERPANIVRGFAAVFSIVAIAELMHRGYPQLDNVLAKNSVGWRTHDSVWIPRYVAVVLPPVLILFAILLSRLPTRVLRVAAVLFVLVVNLSQHAARLFAGSEPPTSLLAQDLIDSHNGRVTMQVGALEKSVTTRSYYTVDAQNFSEAGPGGAPMFSSTFRYYLALQSGEPFDQLRPRGPNNPYVILPNIFRWVSFDGYVIADVRRTPSLKRIVVWSRLQPGEIDVTDPLLQLLVPEWRLESQEDFVARDHWRWLDTSIYRRRVYLRYDNETDTNKPTTRPPA